MASYKGVDIAGLQSLISSYRTAIENSNDDEAIANLNNEQILKSNNNAYFLKLLENIQNKKSQLSSLLSTCESMIQLIQEHISCENRLDKLNERLNNLDSEEDSEEISNINDEIESCINRMNELESQIESLASSV